MKTKIAISYDSESKDNAIVMFEGKTDDVAAFFVEAMCRNPLLGAAIMSAATLINYQTIQALQQLVKTEQSEVSKKN